MHIAHMTHAGTGTRQRPKKPNAATPKLYRPTCMDGPKQEPTVEVLSSLLACAKKGARAATLC